MAVTLELTDLANLQNESTAVSAINANNEAVEAAFLNVLALDGSSPNSMTSSLDMNSNRILNLPLAVSPNEPIRLAEAGNAIVQAANAAASATASAASAASSSASATSAGSSATAATSSATSAATSATTATTQATNASTSATAAAVSATAAANSVSAIKWNFDSSTTMAAPASGSYRFNNATVASVTAIAVNATDADGNTSNAIVNTWDDSTSTIRGTIKVRKLSNSTTYALFNVTASVTDNSSWLQLSVAYVASSGSFSAADACDISFSRTGDAGSGTLAGMSSHGIPIANGASSLGSSIALTDGQLIVGQTGADPLAKTITGDVTITAAGATAIKASVILTTPILGTPTSGTLTNCTGLPVAGITSSTSTALGVGTLELGAVSDTTLSRASAGVLAVEGVSVYPNIPINSQSTAYPIVLADANTVIYHPGADTTARTFTIPANGSVAFPTGTTLTFINDTLGGVITIAITSDTLVFAPSGSTGSRSLAASGIATAVKMTSTRWMISGTGLT